VTQRTGHATVRLATWVIVAVLAALLGGAAGARARDADDAVPKAETRIYDIREFLIIVKDYPYWSVVQPPTWEAETFSGPYPGEQPSGFFDDREEEDPRKPDEVVRAERVEEMIVLITETVDQTSWRRAGGDPGSIRALQGQLVVTQTPANHQKIQNLLDTLRVAVVDLPMLSVQARWLAVAPETATKLLAAGGAPIEVKEEHLKGATTVYRGVTAGFNGQLVHLAKGRGQSFLTGMEPVVAENASAMRPVVEKVLWGVVLEVRPTLSADRGSITLDLRSAVSDPDPSQAKAGAIRVKLGKGAPGGPKPAHTPSAPTQTLDRLAFLVQTLRTTVKMPLDKPMLIGAMTEAASAGPGKTEGKTLLLVVKVTAAKPTGRKVPAKRAKPPPRPVRKPAERS